MKCDIPLCLLVKSLGQLLVALSNLLQTRITAQNPIKLPVPLIHKRFLLEQVDEKK